MGGGLVIWTFKQERNCSTISVCYSGCEMTPRRNSFARRQPPIQPVLDASFLLMQRSGTHALGVKLTGSHLPALRFRSFELIVECPGEKSKRKSIKIDRFWENIYTLLTFARPLCRKSGRKRLILRICRSPDTARRGPARRRARQRRRCSAGYGPAGSPCRCS